VAKLLADSIMHKAMLWPKN